MKYRTKCELAYNDCPRVSVEENIGELNKREWSFEFIGGKFVIDRYIYGERPTKRHKFRGPTVYYRLSHRDSNIEVGDVPLPRGLIKAVQKSASNYYLTARVEKD